MRQIATDVAIVGSGFGAAPPALRLSQAGARVTVLEKGPSIDPDRDFERTHDPKYLQRYLKSVSGKGIGFTYAEALGGGSGSYEMVSLRAPTSAFEQTDRDGRRLWPRGVDRRAMDPYYEIGERMLKVQQLSADRVPKSGVVFSLLMKRLGYSCERARFAVQGCVGSGYCLAGCTFGAKQSLLVNYLPAARAAGATVVTGVEVRKLRGGAGKWRYELYCRGVGGADDAVVRAQTVVLAGGTVGTARLLLASRDGLPRLGPHVGRHVAFNGSVKAMGILPPSFLEADMSAGMSHPGMISYEFWESRRITIAAGKAPAVVVVASGRLSRRGQATPCQWGRPHAELMRNYRHRMMVLYALGLTAPSAELCLEGPRFTPRLVPDESLRVYHEETLALLHMILERNGCEIVDIVPTDYTGRVQDGLHFDSAHMTGSCRMADRPEDGVVDPRGECFGHRGLFVTDGAAIPTSLGVNPSLTILANAERAAAALVGSCG